MTEPLESRLSGSDHTCSAYTQEQCPECGFEDTRDAFEGWTEGKWHVICPQCEADHPNQSDDTDDGCDACQEEEMLNA